MVQAQQQTKNTIKLGIWGTRSAGKTVYMLMLYHYLRRSKGKEKFQIKVDQETDKFLERELDSNIYQGKFPLPTDPKPQKDKHNSYSYKLQRDNSDTIVELTFLDLSGETWEKREKNVKTNNASGKKNDEVSVAKYLTQCHGILILLSPLKEDYGDSYFSLLEGLFRLMQTEIPEFQFKLEQYVVFGITKADHEEIYQRIIDKNFEELIMEIIGSQAPLEWLESYFYLEIVEKKDGTQEVNEDGENNRCCFFPISPFARYTDKDGQIICPVSPVIPNANKTEDELQENEPQQEQPKGADRRQEKQRKDPFKNPSKKQNNSNDDYETPSTENNSEGGQTESQSSYNDDFETPSSPNYPETNQKTQQYKIDKDVTWRPLNVVQPIEWLIERIENRPPKIFDEQQQAE